MVDATYTLTAPPPSDPNLSASGSSVSLEDTDLARIFVKHAPSEPGLNWFVGYKSPMITTFPIESLAYTDLFTIRSRRYSAEGNCVIANVVLPHTLELVSGESYLTPLGATGFGPQSFDPMSYGLVLGDGSGNLCWNLDRLDVPPIKSAESCDTVL
jgi:hypothetical protein